MAAREYVPPIWKYPDLPPVGTIKDAGLEGLGAQFNRGGEGLTPWVDYIAFNAYRPKYEGGAILESVRNAEASKGGKPQEVKTDDFGSVYLYVPSNIGVNYAASYSNTKFGVGGLAAAQMLGSSGSKEIAETLKNAAGGATPEFGFNAVAEASNNLARVLGTEGNVTGSQLAAVSEGRIFNPYEELIFDSVTFRAHSFNWKLVGRSKKEAEDIANIIKFFKRNMLPTYDNNIKSTASTPPTATPASPTIGERLGTPFPVTGRYLQVPSRMRVQFIRVYRTEGSLSSKTASVPLFKLKDCVIDGLQVNYTPDGGYVNTNDLLVPAIELQMTLKEIAIVTASDIDEGY
jgi:hypothetical protein